MGEQSPLAVRGQSMQDVIFGGGRGVQPRSAAEVEIVLDNSDGTVDIPLSEISIIRRLERNGEGGYRLNGARCRLTDVIEVLSDTGLGKESHSVISQGRVECDRHLQAARAATADRGGRRPRQAPQAQAPGAAQARAHPGEPRPRPGHRARGPHAPAPSQAPGRSGRAARAARAADTPGPPRARPGQRADLRAGAVGRRGGRGRSALRARRDRIQASADRSSAAAAQSARSLSAQRATTRSRAAHTAHARRSSACSSAPSR